MISYDLHIHTVHCGHADPEQTVANIVRIARERGLGWIAITEHLGYLASWEHIERIRDELDRAGPDIPVLIGGEVDADPNYPDGRLAIDGRGGLDIVLGSLHWLPGTDILPHCEPIPALERGELIELWAGHLLGVTDNPLVDVLTHPGAMIGNCLKGESWSDDVLEVFAAAARQSARHDIAWEVNSLLGDKLSPQQRRDYHRVLQCALDAGVNLVFGSDAHKPDSVGIVSPFVQSLVDRLELGDMLDPPRLLKVAALSEL